jgi:hypothetical protein
VRYLRQQQQQVSAASSARRDHMMCVSRGKHCSAQDETAHANKAHALGLNSQFNSIMAMQQAQRPATAAYLASLCSISMYATPMLMGHMWQAARASSTMQRIQRSPPTSSLAAMTDCYRWQQQQRKNVRCVVITASSKVRYGRIQHSPQNSPLGAMTDDQMMTAAVERQQQSKTVATMMKSSPKSLCSCACTGKL